MKSYKKRKMKTLPFLRNRRDQTMPPTLKTIPMKTLTITQMTLVLMLLDLRKNPEKIGMSLRTKLEELIKSGASMTKMRGTEVVGTRGRAAEVETPRLKNKNDDK